MPSQRKPKRKPKQKVANPTMHDHAYFTPLPVVADIAESLLEEEQDVNYDYRRA